jgi:hypothetical protein
VVVHCLPREVEEVGRYGVTAFLSGLVLGAFTVVVVLLLTISVKTKGGDA